MATIHSSGNVDLLSGKVAVLGFGSQGHAHALNLHDSGVDVMVGLRPGSASRDSAEAAGLAVGTVAEAVEDAQLVSFLLPDQVQPSVYEQDVAPNLPDGTALVFAHGFNVHYGTDRTARGPRRLHGRAEGARDTSSGGSSPRASARRPSSLSRRTRAARRSSSRSRTGRRSAPGARG